MDNGLKVGAQPRIGVVDSLRGFAIAAIFLIHSSNHFLYGVFPAESCGFIETLNSSVREALYFLFEGKAYVIFALLFGFTFALQMENYRRRKKGDFGGIMLWRLVLLIFIGIFNAALFAGGDPLVFYALAMMFVLPFRRASNTLLLSLAVVFLLQPFAIFNSYVELWGTNYTTSYIAMGDVLMQAEFWPTIWANITLGLKGCLLWALELGRFEQTLGLFALGMLCYRWRVLEGDRSWSRLYPLYIVVTIILFLVKEHISVFAVRYYNLFFALSMIAIFVELHRCFVEGWIFGKLAIYGRMSLTNFVVQSLFGAILYYPWGLHLAPRMGVASSVLLTLGLILVQILFSGWWLAHHKRGPLEQLWHRLTYIK